MSASLVLIFIDGVRDASLCWVSFIQRFWLGRKTPILGDFNTKAVSIYGPLYVRSLLCVCVGGAGAGG